MLSLNYFIQTAHRAVEAASDAACRKQSTPAAAEMWELAERYGKMLVSQAEQLKAQAIEARVKEYGS